MKKIWELAGFKVYEMAQQASEEIDKFLGEIYWRYKYLPIFITKRIFKLDIQQMKWPNKWSYKVYKFWKLAGEKVINF